jgi:hypothetical protein
MEDNKSKAEVLIKQFQSVFTDEDMPTLPQMGTSKTQDISSIQIQEKGIAKLLSKLNINKASGPDTISCRILREATDEIAPYLKFIFEKSLELKNVP